MISLDKLRERKLVQWALAYLAGAWLALQLVTVLADVYTIPSVVVRAVPVLLVAGFFAVLVLAWYHGERGEQRVGGVELLMLAGILLTAGVGVAILGSGPEPDPLVAAALEEAPIPAAVPAAVPAAEQGSIAVLPFVNLSADPEQEYFSDGLTEELLNVLATLPELRVASRTSAFVYKDSKVPVDSIARALRVANVLEGSVRRSGERVRVAVQLINATTGYHLWGASYDRELKDVFAIQDEISRAIVHALELELSSGRAGSRLAREETRDPEAHALVLRGLYLQRQSTRESLERATALYHEAIRRDPAYARAYAGLARSYGFQAYLEYGPADALVRKAREAAERALALDPSLAEAHHALAEIASFHDWDFRTAEEGYRQAIELNPGLASAHSRLGWLLMQRGRPEEAIAEAKRAAELDPVVPGLLSNLGSMYAYARQPERAAEAYHAALQLQPESALTLANLAFTYVDLGQHAKALETAKRALERAPDDQFVLATLAYIHGRAGRRAEAERIIGVVEAQTTPNPYLLATAYAPLGDAGRVFALLERAVQTKDPSTPDLGVDPVFDTYRSDPRMRRLLDRMELP
jgi:TolB-like protein/Flp pilus assembly protein TadD